MPSILIRDLADEVKASLRKQAKLNQRSMEEEARQILNAALLKATIQIPGASIGRRIHRRFVALGGIELQLPDRTPMKPLPSFGAAKRIARR